VINVWMMVGRQRETERGWMGKESKKRRIG